MKEQKKKTTAPAISFSMKSPAVHAEEKDFL